MIKSTYLATDNLHPFSLKESVQASWLISWNKYRILFFWKNCHIYSMNPKKKKKSLQLVAILCTKKCTLNFILSPVINIHTYIYKGCSSDWSPSVSCHLWLKEKWIAASSQFLLFQCSRHRIPSYIIVHIR